MRISTLVLALLTSTASLIAQEIRIDNPPIVTGEFEKQARYLPWSGEWWPMAQGRLGFGWTRAKTYTYNEDRNEFTRRNKVQSQDLSPLAKYDAFVQARYGSDPGAALHELKGDDDWYHYVYGARKEEFEKQGVSYNWWGHCNGWTAASVMEAEPYAAVEAGGIRFDVADLKGLLTESYFGCDAYFTGRRYNKPSEAIEEASDTATELLESLTRNRPADLQRFKDWFRSAYNRESTFGTPQEFRSSLERYISSYRSRYTDAYEDIKPSVFHRILTTVIGTQGSAVCFDTSANEEVWNFPVWKYRMRIDASDRRETINGRSLKVFEVDCTVWHAKDGVSESTIGLRSSEINYRYELYCDDRNVIVDGAWVGSSTDRHPDFAWLPYQNDLGPDSNENEKLEFRKLLEILPQIHATSQENPIEVFAKVDGQYRGSRAQRPSDSTVTLPNPVLVRRGRSVEVKTTVSPSLANVAKVVYFEQRTRKSSGESTNAQRGILFEKGISEVPSAEFAATLNFSSNNTKFIIARAYDAQGRLLAQDEITVKF